jgi:predicted short-subunit dehydrogenase-like oxidoreductase (DUF2520 family)
MTSRHIAIVGAGRVGDNLLRRCLLRELHVDAVIDRDADARARIIAAFPHLRVHATPDDLTGGFDIVIIAVPDAAIPEAAAGLFRIALEQPPAERPLLVMHTSGLRTSRDLAALEGTGAICGSMHPIQSFPAPDLSDEDLDGIACGIEGNEEFLSAAAPFAFALGWHPMVVTAEMKPLYHAACVFAGNFPVACAAAASTLLAEATGDRRVPMAALLPLMQSVLRRLWFAAPEEALTGPAARGDAEAIGQHLAALQAHAPQLAALYRELSRATLDIGTLDPELRHYIRTLLNRD